MILAVLPLSNATVCTPKWSVMSPVYNVII